MSNDTSPASTEASALMRKSPALPAWVRTWGLWIAMALLLSTPLLLGLHYVTGRAFAWRGLAAGLGITGLLLASAPLHRYAPKTWSIAAAIVVTIVFFTHILYFGTAQFSGRGFDDGFFLSLQAEAVDMAWNQYTRYFVIFGVGLAVIYAFIHAHASRPAVTGPKGTVAIVLLSLFLLAKGYHTIPLWQLATATKTWIHPSNVEIPPGLTAKWSGNRIVNLDLPTKSSLQAKAAAQPRNLILLYVESGGVMMKPATRYPGIAPNFERMIRTDSLVPFIHASSYFTMEGLVNTQCGTLLPFEGGNDSMAGFGNRVYQMPCLGDVLHKAGYEQIYYAGTSRNFAGAGPFLELHGYDRVVGQEDWARRNVYQTPGSYGISDKDLLQESIAEIKRLDAAHRPYNLTIFTIGTHIPGFSYDGCRPYGDGHDRYLNAVHCTDQLVGQWIDQLKQDKLLENTVLVITGDHQVFANEQMLDLFGDDARNYKLPLIVIGQDIPKARQGEGAGYDIAPTVLDLLGIETNAKFALGRSLLRPDARDGYFVSRYNDFHKGGIYTSHGQDVSCQPGSGGPAPAGGDIATPLGQCDRAELASLLKYQARKYSERVPKLDCTAAPPLAITEAKGDLKVEFSGEDVSRYFTRIGVPTPAGTPGTYVLQVLPDGQLGAQLYLQPDDGDQEIGNLSIPRGGTAIVVGLPGRTPAPAPLADIRIDGEKATAMDGIRIYRSGSPGKATLLGHTPLAQGYRMTRDECTSLTGA